MDIRTIGLKNKVSKIILEKVSTDEDEALLWESNQTSTVNSNVTFVLTHINFPELEAIYEKGTNRLLMFNINTDMLDNDTEVFIVTDEYEYKLDINNIEESMKNFGFNRIDVDGNRAFVTPTYKVIDNSVDPEEENSLVFWLNKYGHRINQIHLKYI